MQKLCATIFILIYIFIVISAISLSGIAILYPIKYSNNIKNVSTQFYIPQYTLYALINTESSFNPNATSNAGAVGLTQILPATAEYICIKNNIDYSSFDLYNPTDNIYLGSLYLRYLFDRFDNRYTALCAYNAGETVVRSWLSDRRYSYDQISLYNIPYKETNNYIKKIKKAEQIYIKFYKLN